MIAAAVSVTDWHPLSPDEELEVRPLRRLAEPFLERRFTYERYDAFLAALVEGKVRAVPLREFAAASRAGPLVGMRHDVDVRLDSALRLARLEHARGIRATYFILHTAGYYERDPDLIPKLLELQDLGHEVGWHNDLLTLQCVRGLDARSYLERELERLRGAGVEIVGTSAHGSAYALANRAKNYYFFADLRKPAPGFPTLEPCALGPATLKDFGLEYDADHLTPDLTFTDYYFRQRRRWHPELLDVRGLAPAQAVIVLTHPCHWDRSVGAKLARTVARGALRLRALVRV